MAKRNAQQKALRKLRSSGGVLAACLPSMALDAASDSEWQKESWQSQGKRPKRKLK